MIDFIIIVIVTGIAVTYTTLIMTAIIAIIII